MKLSAREGDVMRLTAQGLTNAPIGAQRGLSGGGRDGRSGFGATPLGCGVLGLRLVFPG